MKNKFYIGAIGDKAIEDECVNGITSEFNSFITYLLDCANCSSVNALPFELVFITNLASKSEQALYAAAEALSITTEVCSYMPAQDFVQDMSIDGQQAYFSLVERAKNKVSLTLHDKDINDDIGTAKYRGEQHALWHEFLKNKVNVLLTLCLVTDVDHMPEFTSYKVISEILHPESIDISSSEKSLVEKRLAEKKQPEYIFSSEEAIPFIYNVDANGSTSNGENTLGTGFLHSSLNINQNNKLQLSKQSEAFQSVVSAVAEVASELAETPIAYSNSQLKDALKNDEKETDASLARFYDFSCKFDALASKHQTKSNYGFWVLFTLTLILGASFLLYAKVFTHSPWLLILYLIAYSGGVYTFYKMKKKSSLKKHLAYRLCAEVLRLKLFQLVSHKGNKSSVFEFERIVSVAKVQTNWIAHIVRSFPLHKVVDDSELTKKKEVVLSYLVEDQINYFHLKLHGKTTTKQATKNSANPKLSGLERILSIFSNTQLFIVLSCLVLIVVVALTAFKVGVFYQLYPIKNIMMFLVGFLPLVGLAMEQLVFNFALEENELRYHHQITKYKAIKRWINAANTQQEVARITDHLCLESAQENFNWYTTRVNRQHKPASGG